MSVLNMSSSDSAASCGGCISRRILLHSYSLLLPGLSSCNSSNRSHLFSYE